MSEVAYSEVVKMSNDFRINSQFFNKQFLQLKGGIKLAFLPLKQLAKVADGDHSKFPDNQLEEVRYLQARDITNNFLEITSDVFVSKEYFSKNQRSIITEETILLSIMGTVGDIAITPKGFQACMCNRALAIIRDIKTISPQFLFAFLITKQAANLIERLKNGGVQQRINLDVLGELEIPNFGSELQDKVTQLVLLAQETRQQAKQKYAQAEQTLLEAVGLADFKPSTQNTNIKTFAQSFGISGRLDAEYYQPKYEEVMAKIANQTHAKLVDVVKVKKSIEPGSDAYADEGLPFIRVSDFSKHGLTTPDKCLSDAYVQDNKTLLESLKPKADTVLFSKDGSVGTAYLLRENLHGVTSGAILHLSLKRDDVLPEYLTLVLNSKLVQMQAERDAGGSIILHWRVGEIENVILPIIDLAIQTNISKLVQQSFTLKAQSEHLLNVTKRAVEIAIETDEQTAVAYINEQTGEK